MIDFDVGGAEFGDGLGFGESNSSDFWMGEDDGWDIFVGEVGV
jgi:hypothetical protein